MPIKFCGSCASLLYPKAMSDKKLHFECRLCDFMLTATDPADQRIRRDELLSVVKEKKGITQDVELDPTLTRSNMQCPYCHATSAVQFQDQSNEIMRKSTAMILFYRCLQCRQDFRDPKSEEGPHKEAERRAREERLAAKNNKAGKPEVKPEGNAMQQALAAKPTPAPGPTASVALSGTGNTANITVEDSDDDDY